MGNRTLVIGCQSYIGKQFYAAYRATDPQALGTHYRACNPEQTLDLLAPDLTPLNLKKGDYQWAFIAAANTHLLRCEQEKDLSFRPNVEGTLQLVEALKQKGIIPILLSSDYVFDGKEGGYREDSPKNPLNEYGRQKDLLETGVAEICGNDYLIVRCSKIFGLNRGDRTLIDQIVGPLSLQQPIKAAYDQWFAPIHELDVIRAVLALQEMNCRGLFNLCGSEIWTRLDLAREIGKLLAVDENLIQPVSLDDLKIPYRLPKRTYMNCDKFAQATHLQVVPLSRHLKKIEAIYDAIDRKATVG